MNKNSIFYFVLLLLKQCFLYIYSVCLDAMIMLMLDGNFVKSIICIMCVHHIQTYLFFFEKQKFLLTFYGVCSPYNKILLLCKLKISITSRDLLVQFILKFTDDNF